MSESSLESLLAELSTLGWTISWAFQYSPGEWRMSIIRIEDVGAEQGTYLSHCAFAPTFAEALEDCMSKMAEAEFEPREKQHYTIEGPRLSLLEALAQSLPQPAPIRRRV